MAELCVPVSFNDLRCRICRKVFWAPTTLLCGHNFCTQCIHNCWERDRRIRCPECGCMFPYRPQLIENTTLTELVRLMKKVADSRKTPDITFCKRHNNPLDIYCYTDDMILCEEVGVLTEHLDHTIGFVEQERKIKQEELKNMQMKSKQMLQQQEKKWEKLQEIHKQIQEEAGQTKDHCEIMVASAIDSLQRYYLSVRERVEAQEQAVTAQVQANLMTLTTKMEEMKKREAELDRLAHTKSDVIFLKEWRPLQLLCENSYLQSLHEVSEDPLLPLKSTKRSVEQLGKKLEEFCDKELTSVFPADFSGVNSAQLEQGVEPTTRAQFLQYACNITLDPTTAHESLCVSEGDKEVKLSPQKNTIPAIYHPDRFIRRRQVLCRERLQAERCYYEVEVQGEKAEIALTYKGIERKSYNTRSAFGANALSWSLDLSKNYSVSHKSDSILLRTPRSHNRIGVYLKFTEGTLTFYEVSDSMTFLYRVQASFTEPLYPGFWLGEKCCIRICNLRHDTH